MAHYHAQSLKDALRELAREPIDYSEVVEDSEPERVAAAEASKKAKNARFAHTPLPWDWLEREAERSNASKRPDAGYSRTLSTTSDSAVQHEVIDVDKDEGEIGALLRKTVLKFKHPATSTSSKRSSANPGPSSSTTPRPTSPSTDSWLFTSVQCGHIHSCVGCDTRWTSRKTAPQKLAHMRACARKRGLSDDTIRMLLQRQLDDIASGNAAPATSTSTPRLGPSAQPPPTTYLETIINEARMKKRTKTPMVTSSILPAAQARTNILAKADEMLRGEILRTTSTEPVVLDAGDEPSSISDQHLRATQTLLRNHLSTGAPSSSSLFSPRTSISPGNEEEEEELDPTPATQVLPSSRLASAIPRAIATYASKTPEASPRSSHFHHLPASPIVISSNDPSPAMSRDLLKSRESQRPASPGGSDEDPWLQDDPNLDGGATMDNEDLGGVRRYSYTVSTQARRYSELLSPADYSSGPEAIELPTALPSPTSPKKRGRPRNAAATQSSISTAAANPSLEFNAMMKECIIRDTQLYLRILRYEPIHFDVFAKLALDRGFEKRILLAKLRNFLDEEAINFHTNELGASNSRRRRR